MSETERILGLLGLSRRAGRLSAGQDNVFEALHTGAEMLVIISEDCSENVLRSLKAAEERGEAKIMKLEGINRNILGARIGLKTAQVAALPLEDSFSIKILSLNDRS